MSRRVALLAAGCLLLAGAALAQPEQFGRRGRVSGLVQARDGRWGTLKPLPGAVVQITSMGDSLRRVLTDSTGHFSVVMTAGQPYELLADHPGCFTARGYVNASAACFEDQPGAARQLPPLTLSRIYTIICYTPFLGFDYNQTGIRPDAARWLDTAATTMLDNPRIRVQLSATADQRGPAAYNLRLSQRRAEAAAAYLVGKGINPARITTRGYGETRPLVKHPRTEEDYQRNRRVEIWVQRVW